MGSGEEGKWCGRGWGRREVVRKGGGDDRK